MESSKEVNYWPGFVDALTNTVIAVIFLVIVLTLSLTVFVSALVKQRIAKEMANTNAACSIKQGANPNAGINIATDKKPSGAVPPPVAVKKYIKDNEIADGSPVTVEAKPALMPSFGKGTMYLRFEDKDIVVDDHSEQQLAELARRQGIVPSQVAVELEVRANHLFRTDNQRTAFFRSMAVRDALMKRGVHPLNINVRLIEAGVDEAGLVSIRFYRPGPR